MEFVGRRRCGHFVRCLSQRQERGYGGLATFLGQTAFCFCRGKVSGAVFWAGKLFSLLGLEASFQRNDRVWGLGDFGTQPRW